MSKIAQHLFISDCDGALHDTRAENWASEPLRPIYKRHYAKIENTQQLRATLRAGRSTSIGCYPLFLITSDGATIDFQCAIDNYQSIAHSIKTGCNDGWRVVGCDVNYESELYCDHCGEQLESAYGIAEND